MTALKREFPGIWWMKTHGDGYQRTGIPDLIGCVEGAFFALEVKAPKPGEKPETIKGRATAKQLEELAGIREAGGTQAIVWNVGAAIEVVQRAVDWARSPLL